MHPWPELLPEDLWLIDFFEESLRSTSHSPEELRERARELRVLPERTGIGELRGAALALAERYESAADRHASQR